MGKKTARKSAMQPISILIAVLFLLQCRFSGAQTVPPPPNPQPIVSPAVHPDGSVTFRVRVPYAHQVLLDLEGAKPLNMERDDSGVWSITTAPLQPEYYGYIFRSDEVPLIDPFQSSALTQSRVE